ncbi:hypothetical protein ACH9L7_14885 [Haloferax sp. S1W]|uniref:hypothetical protein n=1 Tax=Haloferax sp. S1W TaxID=3377110 RepID=UPI0037C604BD
MSAQGDRFRKSLQDISDEDWILSASVVLVLLAFLVSGFSYYFIDQAMTLFFYAVLVRIWTQMGSGLPMSSKRDIAHLEFMVNAIGAVVIGYTLEWSVAWVTGDMVAVQSLALAAVISRVYINMRDDNVGSLKDIIRYDQTVDRYLVLVPSAVAFSAPVLVHQLDIYSIRFNTPKMFFGLVVGSVLFGLVLYNYEKD